MDENAFLTYIEYKAYCYMNRMIPKRKDEIGTGLLFKDLVFAEKVKKDHTEAFEFLSNDGIITRESLKKALKKLKLDSSGYNRIFSILNVDCVDKKLFESIF